MTRSKLLPFVLAPIVVGGTVLLGFSDWQKADPAQWSTDDVYRILNNSPWSKAVKASFSRSSGDYNDQTPGDNAPPNGRSNGGTWGSGGQMPGGIGGGGMGRGGMGGGGGGMGGGGWGGNNGGGGRGGRGNNSSQQTEVTIQWQSALPVRLAAAKKTGDSVDPSSFKPLDEYVIALIGFPSGSAGEGRRPVSADSDDNGPDQADQTQQRLMRSASLLRGGHDAINPTKVEMNQGTDGRILLHFAKTDPITLGDKDVELRVSVGRLELRKKFNLKEMEFQGRLEL